jgi:hypothetical protein
MATRWKTRVPSLTSTRDDFQRSTASASVGSRSGSWRSFRSGTRSAASSPTIHDFRICASRFVLKLPPYLAFLRQSTGTFPDFQTREERSPVFEGLVPSGALSAAAWGRSPVWSKEVELSANRHRIERSSP